MTRILAFDTSLSSPGAAVIEIKRNKPKLTALSHVKTDGKQSHGLRADIVESWATMFIADNIGRGFDHVVREDFHGMSSAQNYPVFAAWSGCERAAVKFGLTFDKFVDFTKKGKRKSLLGVPQSKVKLLVVGRGKAEKDEVAEAVRELTGYREDFIADDRSDAAAVGLAWAIQNGLITKGSD
jgi:crossover junction endodeoxyribonuclease RuvC